MKHDEGAGIVKAVSPPRILHIGQRKTGTTWLQSAAEEARLAGRMEVVHRALTKWQSPLKWNTLTDSDYEAFRNLIAIDHHLPLFATNENLIILDPARLSRELYKVWPNARIMITTRAPADYLISSFNNDSKSRSDSASDFAARFARTHMLRSHNLNAIAKEFDDVFGSDSVKFIPYELLRDNKTEFIGLVSDLLSVDMTPYVSDSPMNASPPAIFLLLERQIVSMIRAADPKIIETRAWTDFVRFANYTAGAARESCEEILRQISRAGTIPESMPLMTPSQEQKICEQMTVLRALPLYQPYLRAYGLLHHPAQKPET